MITGHTFAVSENMPMENPNESWRTRSRKHVNWNKTFMREHLIRNYPNIPHTNEDIEILKTNIPEASRDQIKEFFMNYKRSGPNERFKPLKREIKDEVDRRKSCADK